MEDDVSVIALHTFPSIITSIKTWLTFTDLSRTGTTESYKHFISSSTLAFSSFEVTDSLVNSILSGLVEDGRWFFHGTRYVMKTGESVVSGSRNDCLYELCPELPSNPHLLY